MNRELKKSLMMWSSSIVLCAALYGTMCLYMYWNKPVFANEFGVFGKLGPLPSWHTSRSDTRDIVGNRFVADFRMNLFVIVQLPTSNCPPWVFENDELEAGFVLGNDKSCSWTPDNSIRFAIAKNTLVRIRADGTVESHPLGDGFAEILYGAVQKSDADDKMSVVEGLIGAPNEARKGVR